MRGLFEYGRSFLVRVPAPRWLGLMACLGSSLFFCSSVALANDARIWLQRMHSAAMERNYQGTMVFTAGAMISSSKVAHYCVGKDSFEWIEAQGGRMQRSFRHNDLVHTLWPQDKRALIEPRGAFTPVALPSAPAEVRVEEHYEWKALGADRVAGREVQVFRLQPRDGWRFAQRLWVDSSTGLMLRTDVLGAKDEMLETSAFIEIDFTVKPRPEQVIRAMNQLDGYQVERPRQRSVRLAEEGWRLDPPVPGFRLSSAVKRQWGSRDEGGRSVDQEFLQTVFNDGLTHLSLFIETFDPSRHKQTVHTRMGATHTLMQRVGDQWWVTAMGDVPSVTLQSFLQSLKRTP